MLDPILAHTLPRLEKLAGWQPPGGWPLSTTRVFKLLFKKTTEIYQHCSIQCSSNENKFLCKATKQFESGCLVLLDPNKDLD